MRWKAPAIWQDGEAWIIGGGPSMPRQFNVPEDIIKKVMAMELPPAAYSEYMEPIHKKHVIAVNNAYRIGNWIDVLFFGDGTWYTLHKEQIAKFPGLKVTRHPKFEKTTTENIKWLAPDTSHPKGITTNKSKISWNTNSGMAAINLAVHFGAKRIILLGFDFCRDSQTKLTHWHGSHRKPGEQIPEQPFKKRIENFKFVANDAKALGIEILNASGNSAIKEFPIVSAKDYF